MSLQSRLKEETKTLHDLAESHQFNHQLINGTLKGINYFVYLHNLFPVFSYLERRMNLSGEMVRSPLMHCDIMRYSKEGSVIEGKDLVYFDWISEIGKMPEKMLPAILYVEWLKDAYGGQIIAKHVKHNSHLCFNRAKDVIDCVRSYLDKVPEEDHNEFIAQVNKVYENHTKILDSIMKT